MKYLFDIKWIFLLKNIKISLIKKYYKDSGAVNYLNKKVKEYSEHAKKIINQMQIDDNKKLSLNKFSEQLLNREI